MVIDDRFIKIPLEDLQTPHNGFRVVVDHWWIVKDGCALLYDDCLGTFPQCNPDERVVSGVVGVYEGCEIVFIPVAYWRGL